MTTQVPESAYTETNTPEGHPMVYFARMLSKIRLFDQGKLREDFHANLGIGADKWCCNYLRVNYNDLKQRTLEGGSNEEILAWCLQNGRALNELDIVIWNGFARKVGWNDFISKRLGELKAENGWSDADEIQTMPDFFEYDEGRKQLAQALHHNPMA